MDWPAYLAGDVAGDTLDYHCNAHLDYAVRGIHVGLDMRWDWLEPSRAATTPTPRPVAAPAPASNCATGRTRDTGRSSMSCRTPISAPRLSGGSRRRSRDYPGRRRSNGATANGGSSIPDALRIGHDPHFAALTRRFLASVERPRARSRRWERPNLLAKYFVCTTPRRERPSGRRHDDLRCPRALHPASISAISWATAVGRAVGICRSRRGIAGTRSRIRPTTSRAGSS